MDEVMKHTKDDLINLIVNDEYNILEDDYSHLYKRKELNKWEIDALFDECLERGLVHEGDETKRDRVIKTNTTSGIEV